MDNETIEIKRKNVMEAYKIARDAGADSTMKVLKALFGKETFKPKDIKERVKTFEDACRELGDNHPYVKAYERAQNYMADGDDDVNAYLKLRIITAALNEGWKPKFAKDECRYYPWFVLARSLYGSSTFGGVTYAYASGGASGTDTYCGSRLAFKNGELAEYAGKQFIGIWVDYIFKPGERGGK